MYYIHFTHIRKNRKRTVDVETQVDMEKGTTNETESKIYHSFVLYLIMTLIHHLIKITSPSLQ